VSFPAHKIDPLAHRLFNIAGGRAFCCNLGEAEAMAAFAPEDAT
jgi:hypothetical protein